MISKWVDKNLKYIFVLPCVIFVVVMIAFPIIYNIALSFCKWSMSTVEPPEFVWFDNYKLLLSEPRFWQSVGRTVYFAVVALLIETVVGVLLAIMLNRKFYGSSVAKTVFLLPVVSTPVAIGMVWMLIYEPTIGFANVLMKSIGLKPLEYLASAAQALPSLILIDVWEWTPMIMLIVHAGLTAIPTEPYESAMVDGASNWQKFRYITLPLVSPSILVAMMLRLIDVTKTFDIIYSTTKGGPGFATETINIYAYVTSFNYFEFGKASAITILFFIVVISVSQMFMTAKKKMEVDF